MTAPFLWDATAFLASAIAGACLLTRRWMLSGAIQRWHSASWLVQAALSAEAIYMIAVAISIAREHSIGLHVSQRETVILVFCAVVAVIMALNLEANRPRNEDGGR